jgi:hypothetical protein
MDFMFSASPGSLDRRSRLCWQILQVTCHRDDLWICYPGLSPTRGSKMALSYGFIKCKLKSDPVMKSSRLKHETQYHVHTKLQSDKGDWDSAINVGTNDSDDLLRYKLVYDYHNSFIEKIRGAAPGFAELKGTDALPALDFLRSDILAETGNWRDSDVMDGSDDVEPAASLMRLLRKARAKNADVYIFGRTYTDGSRRP